MEKAFLAIFVLELVIRLLFRGIRASFLDPWTWFDVVVITISALDSFFLGEALSGGNSAVAESATAFTVSF